MLFTIKTNDSLYERNKEKPGREQRIYSLYRETMEVENRFVANFDTWCNDKIK